MKERALAFMFKIIIQNPNSETVINNVYPEQVPFWESILEGVVQGEIYFESLDGQKLDRNEIMAPLLISSHHQAA